MQLGRHPERLHHRPVRLRPHGPDLRQTTRHEAEAAQPEDVQPAVKRRFWKGVLLFSVLDVPPCLVSGLVQPWAEGGLGRMRLRVSGAVCGHPHPKEAKPRGIRLGCALVPGLGNPYKPLEPVLTTAARLSIP